MRGVPREPGFRDLPVPEKNGIRPNGANPAYWREGEGRQALKYSQPVHFVQDYGSPRPEWPGGLSQSPASGRYTLGLRKSNIEAPVDPSPFTIQTGVNRQ